ncbi:MAG: polysaccharide biosynthesis/export family protein [Rhodomicrobium sp.]
MEENAFPCSRSQFKERLISTFNGGWGAKSMGRIIGFKAMLIAMRHFASFLVAVAVCACGVPPANEAAVLSVHPQASAEKPASEAVDDASAQAKRPSDREAVQKVALSLAAVSDPASKSYKVGPRDTLDITVFKTPELTKTVQVSEVGTFTYPLIGEVEAAGKTARQIESELVKRLGAKYLQNPQITVLVKDYNSQRVTLEGAIKKPGVYPLVGGLTLLQAIAQASGFEDTADHTVALFRQTNGKRLAARYDVSRIRDGQDEDPQLEAGDVIIVSTSDLKEGFSFVLKALPLVSLVPLL